MVTSPPPRSGRPYRLRIAHPRLVAVLAVVCVLAAACGAALGYFMRLDLPDVLALEDYEPPQMTRVLAADGSLLDTFQEQRRILIGSREIPPVFRQALLASEDAHFYQHTGIDFGGILRAAWRDLRSLRLAQGASTLTQQLARNLFLTPKKTIRRKLEEALLAVEIERQYSKEEILAFYCNQIYMGHGRYGLEAAARFYFGTPARELDLNQAATLAGLIQRPEALSPVRHLERTLDRRNYVLRRMTEEGFVGEQQAARVREKPIEISTPDRVGLLAPYFVEEIRRWLQALQGSSTLYRAGFEVRTTLDPELQEIANRAVDSGLRELDKRQGWRGVVERVPGDEAPETWEHPGWSEGTEPGRILPAIVLAVEPERAQVRIGTATGNLGPDEVSWTGESDLTRLFEVGDVIEVAVSEVHEDGSLALALEQTPAAEAALVVLDPSSGAVRALVGGLDFERSEFNRATQAHRQTGSAFKPFVYAAALRSGLTLADTLVDEPTVFLDPRRPDPYQPENYTNRYYGRVTLRTALEKSANIATVKLLNRIGYASVIDTARRLGITSELRPYASMALGAFETTLLELTAAYGAFANEGVLVEPHLVESVLSHDGRLVERIEPKVKDAVNPQIAYLMNRVLSGVISDGTGRAAASLRLPVAGKTGTTDANTDAWFVGYAPQLTVGAWVGFDEPRSLGKRETGARAALPIWRDFMAEAFADRQPEPFGESANIKRVAIDRRTGLRANPQAYCRPVIVETFAAGTEPTEPCSVFEHQRMRLPYPFQRYALNERGALMIPLPDLLQLLYDEPGVRILDEGRRLEAHLSDEIVTIALEVLPGSGPVDANLDPRLARFDTAGWIGKDGRAARIVWIDGKPESPRSTSGDAAH